MFLVIFFERFDGFEKLFLFSLINIKTQLLKRSKEVLVAKKKIRGPSHNTYTTPDLNSCDQQGHEVTRSRGHEVQQYLHYSRFEQL